MVEMNFNSAEFPSEQYDLIPSGWYTAIVDQSEKKDTKSGNGAYLKLRFKIAGPTHSGRTLFMNFNLWNPNAKTVQIANQQFSSLLQSIAKEAIRSTEEIHGIPVQIKIAIKDASDGHDESNEIKRFKRADSVGTASPAAPPQWAPAPAAASTPPWKR